MIELLLVAVYHLEVLDICSKGKEKDFEHLLGVGRLKVKLSLALKNIL